MSVRWKSFDLGEEKKKDMAGDKESRNIKYTPIEKSLSSKPESEARIINMIMHHPKFTSMKLSRQSTLI